jgi:uncharacterized protein DUF1064
MTMLRSSSRHAGWREIGGKRLYARSLWEANYAHFLQFMKDHKQILDWEHEPQTFWFSKIRRGVVSYLPDYKVYNLDGSHHWVEVKGWMDARSATKIKRFKKYFPEEKLIVISRLWFATTGKKLKRLIPGWEMC